MSAYQPRALAALVAQLDALEVTLPAGILHTAAVLEDAGNGDLVRQASQPPTLDPGTADRAALLEHIRQRAILRSITDEISEAAWLVALDAAESTAAQIREHADEIIGQMRPRFDTAAKAVRRAAELGIHAGAAPADVIGLGPDAIDAWAALPEHAAILDAIAAARIAMTDAAGLDPTPDPFGPMQYGACFHPDAPAWVRGDGRGESNVDHWLRLSTSGPLKLLAVKDTRAAAAKWRATPIPTVALDSEGRLSQSMRLAR